MLNSKEIQLEILLNEVVNFLYHLNDVGEKPEKINKYLGRILSNFNTLLERITNNEGLHGFYAKRQKVINQIASDLNVVLARLQSMPAIMLQEQITEIEEKLRTIKQKEEQYERQYEEMVKQLEDIQAQIIIDPKDKQKAIRTYRSNIAKHTYEYQKTLATAVEQPIRYTYDVPTILLLLQMFLIHLRSAL